MKQLLFISLLISMATISCRRNNPAAAAQGLLEGNWLMIKVTNNSTGIVSTKPASVSGDVILRFISSGPGGGTITGNTPTNEIWQNNYTTGPNQLLNIPVLSMTKVGETSWGNLFVSNITNAVSYGFEINGNLYIISPAKTMGFRRL